MNPFLPDHYADSDEPLCDPTPPMGSPCDSPLPERHNASPPLLARKRPRPMTTEELMCYEEAPDLHLYFEGFPNLSAKDIATACRAYATYMSAIQKALAKSDKKKK